MNGDIRFAEFESPDCPLANGASGDAATRSQNLRGEGE